MASVVSIVPFGDLPREELAYRLRQQSLLAEFGLCAIRCSSVDELIAQAAVLCADGMGARLAKVLKYLPAENRLLVVAGVGWREGVVGHATVGADLASPAGYAVKTGVPVISNHLTGESRFRTPELLANHGVKRAINVVIRSQETGHAYGVLEVDSPDAGVFDEADLAFMQGFANLLGVAIERQHKDEALIEARDRLRLMNSEISHRVKNNLALVAGLLATQARGSANDEIGAALREAENRVVTIARVHDRLWRSGDSRTVDLAVFLGDLCDALQQGAPGHRIVCEAAPVTVPTERAIPVGLIINEFVTNALKYAYPGGVGDIRVALAGSGADGFRVEVSDHGIGLPHGFDPTGRQASLGMRVVTSLVRQLGGKLTTSVAGERGACFTIEAATGS